jgi:hypothetical protein
MKGSTALRVYRVEDVPLKEVSGVCLRRGSADELALVAIGDRVAAAAWFVQPTDDMAPVEWHTADLAGLQGSLLPKDDPQIEAVCADGAGRVLLLQEWPTRIELIDPLERRVVASLTLDLPDGHPLAASWTDPDGSHGEGAVFLQGVHLLIAKEKDPTALIEFGPPGEVATGFARGQALPAGAEWPIEPGEHRYVALATWLPDRDLAKACADFSDLEVGPDGHLYLLSDKSGSIARLSDLPPDGGSVSALDVWRIPRLKGKPEGLAFTPNGRPLVALDTRKARHNLVLLEPPIAGA